jgi:hydroxymethylbilane synthase
MLLTIGTRGSLLARTQSEWVAERFREAHTGAVVDLEIITTQGDVVQDRPLTSFSDKGLFTREIETALLEGTLDCAVHSLKDLPSEMPPGLIIAAVPEREDARDVIIVRDADRTDDGAEVLMALKPDAIVGTSSLRRSAQIRRVRPDLRIEDIRGNVDTRLRKLQEGKYDAILLAAAGLHRLGMKDRITAYLPYRIMVPAPGQGALAIQARENDYETLRWLSALDHWATRQAVTAERAFLEALGGGCQTPIAAYADVVGHNMDLMAFVADADGSNGVRDRFSARSEEADWAGKKLARKLRPLF